MSRSRGRVLPWIIVLAAVAVRLLHDAEMSRTPFFRFPGLDASWHDEWARQIVSGNAPGEPYFRAPGYAYFVAAVYRFFGTDPWPIHLVQALLGGLTAWLVYRIARRLYGRTTGYVAASAAALHGPLVYFDGELLAPALAIPLFLLALHLALRSRTARHWLLTGLAFGAGAIVLPNIVLVLAFLAGALAIQRRSGSLASAAALVLGAFLVMLPVIVRNGIVGGDWRAGIATQGGVNLYAGNNPEATGVSVVLPQFARQPGWRDFVKETQAWASTEAGRELKPSETSALYSAKAVAWWLGDPAGALRLAAWKIYYLLNGHEIPNNRDLYSDRKFSRVLALLLWHLGPFHFPFGLVLPLAVLGLLMARPAGSWPLVLFLGGYAASVVLFFVTERYRLPLVPVLIVFAAAAGVRLFRGARPSPVPLAAGVAALLVANSHFGHAGRSNPAQETVRLASAWFDAGDFRRSAEAFQVATRQDPRSAEAWEGLSSALQSAGDRPGALRALDEAVLRGTPDPVTWFNRAALQLEAGRTAEAGTSLERAVALDPRYLAAWVNLGLARSALGDLAGAREALDAALRLDPGNSVALQEKGRVLAASGDIAGARTAMEEALRMAPNAFEPALNLALLDYEQGLLDEAAGRLQALERSAPPEAQGMIHFHLARIAARRGDRTALLDRLGRARAAGFPVRASLSDAAFAAYLSDPDVLALAR